MPLPMVAATAVPKTNAAMKFQNAAHATARNGVRTRVETTVAIECAAPRQPFENSNASVREITISSSEKLGMQPNQAGNCDVRKNGARHQGNHADLTMTPSITLATSSQRS